MISPKCRPRIRPKLLFVASLLAVSTLGAQVREETSLGRTGWALWLDRTASWKSDDLYVPPVNVSGLPVHPPTGGWTALFSEVVPESQAASAVGNSGSNPSKSIEAEVPGTVEQFFWDALSGGSNGANTSGDYVGVSWWGKSFTVPPSAAGKRVKLVFTEGVRQRAEIFVNQQLVGYESIHQLPFEVDVTDAIVVGGVNKLAVRITDPGGNFSWGDFDAQIWGDNGSSGSPSGYLYPQSHGFGGILGEVQLRIVSPVHTTDVFVKNKPALHDIDAEIEITNDGTASAAGTVDVAIVEAWKHNAPVLSPEEIYSAAAGSYSVPAGERGVVNVSASVTEALLWGVRDANLYNLVITVKDGGGAVVDQYTQRFGFRFLSVENYGTDTQFFLNGKRIFILSAISWGFWPVNGIFPTPELARKHVSSALTIGQNMLNFHRCMGNTLVLDAADEMGILYYEEPGGYSSGQIANDNPLRQTVKNYTFNEQMTSQRVVRMVKRDRSRPSLVQYNMVNEAGRDPSDLTKADMAAMHLADPTRLVSYSSGFMDIGGSQDNKLHMLPYDQTQRTVGFCDVHNAGNSPGCYVDSMYKSPTAFLRNDQDPAEIFIWGEEGAIASPPQVELIHQELELAGRNGWDGADYRRWYSAYADYIESKGLSEYYPSITALLQSLANIAYYEHGRLVENVRIADSAEVYILNGYEDMKLDNLSGIVDIYRNVKGDPNLIAQYMEPLVMSVKARGKIGQVGETNLVDLFVLNENAVPAGSYPLTVTLEKPDGSSETLLETTASVSGGTKFSDLVAEGLSIPLDAGPGYYRVKAHLEANGEVADGHDEILAVDWQSDQIGGKGAVVSGDTQLLRFLQDVKGADAVPYSSGLGKLDYIVLAATDQGTTFNTVSPYNFRALDGQTIGLNVDLYRGTSFNTLADQRVSASRIDYDANTNLIPGSDIVGTTNFSVRMQGSLIADYTGATQFEIEHDDGARVWVNGVQVVDAWSDGPSRTDSFTVNMVAGQTYAIKIEAYQSGGGWRLNFRWKLPVAAVNVDLPALLSRVEKDGTKLLVLDRAESWLTSLSQANSVIEAENFASMSGIEAESCNEGGQNIGFINNGDYAIYNNVDLDGVNAFRVRYASDGSGGTIEIRLNGPSGTLLGSCPISVTGGWQAWQTTSSALSAASGTHNVCLVFKGGSGYLFNLNWFQLYDSSGAPASLPSYSVFHPAKTWVGHNLFVRDHPFFKDLPVNQGMNWEYQKLVPYDGPTHFGLYNISGEEPVVSLVGGPSQLVSTSVGILPYGTGEIVFSSLDLVSNLTSVDKSANVPKKILCNMLTWAMGTTEVNYPSPANLTATALSESQVQLDWDNSPKAEAYVVERSLHGAGLWTTLTNSLTTSNFVADGLSASTAYDFRVRYLADGTASTNAKVSITTPAGVGDGIPGWWRYQYFGNGTTVTAESAADADPDGDGASNRKEYLAGTHPRDAASVLRIRSINAQSNAVNVTFDSVSGKIYALEKALHPGSGETWTQVGSDINGTGAPILVTDPAALNETEQFYRVRLLGDQ